MSFRKCNSHDSASVVSNRKMNSERLPSASLRTLSKHKKFDEILFFLQNGETRAISSWLKDDYFESIDSSGNPLHAVLMYRPPVQLVDILCKRLKELRGHDFVPEEEFDSEHRNALHIAAAQGCDITVIERLLLHGAGASRKVDSRGRYPLHWACTNPRGAAVSLRETCWSSSSFAKSASFSRSKKSGCENMIKVIYTLTAAFPESVVHEDFQGRTPVDIAVESGADDRIISALVNRATKSTPKPHQKGTDDTATSTRGTEECSVTYEIDGYENRSPDFDISTIFIATEKSTRKNFERVQI